jgi:hypothetical protein
LVPSGAKLANKSMGSSLQNEWDLTKWVLSKNLVYIATNSLGSLEPNSYMLALPLSSI